MVKIIIFKVLFNEIFLSFFFDVYFVLDVVSIKYVIFIDFVIVVIYFKFFRMLVRNYVELFN